MTIDWNKARDEVHRENTAQAIHEHLERLNNQAERFQRRWIWELFQNALDAAWPNAGITLRLSLNGNFVLSHNGVPFSTKEILHLIFHGSTKREKEDSIGRYGTGFLATHVISRRVRVSGVLESEQAFDFVLDRGGATPSDLASAMELSEQGLRQSVDENPRPGERWTNFEYELSASGRSVVQSTLRDIRQLAPLVLVFNPRIEKVQIEDGNTCSFSVRREKVSDEICLVSVEVAEGETHRHCFVVSEEDEVTVIVPLVERSGGLGIGDINGIPRLFVAFPLIGTETLPLPFIVNSPKAKPTEERNGLYLNAEDTADNRRNKAVIQKAWGVYAKVVGWAADNGVQDLHRLARVRPASDFDWLDISWFNEVTAKRLQETIVTTPLVRVEAKRNLSPTSIIFPQPESAEIRNSFRTIAEAFHGPVIPDADVCEEWEEIVGSWSLLTNLNSIGIRTETLASLSSQTSSHGSVAGVAALLEVSGSGLEQFTFLNTLYDLLLRSGEVGAFEKLPLLPNQLGDFKRRTSLKQDDNIDEELKGIAHSLGHPLRTELLDRRVDNQVQALLTPFGQENLIATVLKLTMTSAQNQLGSPRYVSANANLLGWLARNRKMNELKAFPIISKRSDSSGMPLLVDQRDQLLLPIDLWTADLRAFAELFPDRNICSDAYASVLGPSETKWLEEIGCLLPEPIVKKTGDLTGTELERLLERPFSAEEEEKEHLVRDIEVEELRFLTLKDRGILDMAEGSRSRGAKFLAFVFEYLLPRSAGAMEYSMVSCACGKSHSIHRALWLPPIRERQWVNERKNHGGQPTAQNLSRLWHEDARLKRKLADDAVLLFLNRIGVSASEILMHLSGGNDHEMQKAFVSLLNAADNRPEQLLTLAEVLVSDPGLLGEFAKRKERRERTRLNQQLGFLVEAIFKALFQRPEVTALGLSVRRTGRGSDFAIEYDLVEDDQEWLLSLETNNAKVLVELKATRESFVEMTHVQAQEAVAQQDRFVLCVVPIPAGQAADENIVKGVARFVTGIGQRLVHQVAMVEDIQNRKLQTVSYSGAIDVVIQSGVVRYRVKDQVWFGGMSFESFVTFLVTQLAESKHFSVRI